MTHVCEPLCESPLPGMPPNMCGERAPVPAQAWATQGDGSLGGREQRCGLPVVCVCVTWPIGHKTRADRTTDAAVHTRDGDLVRPVKTCFLFHGCIADSAAVNGMGYDAPTQRRRGAAHEQRGELGTPYPCNTAITAWCMISDDMCCMSSNQGCSPAEPPSQGAGHYCFLWSQQCVTATNTAGKCESCESLAFSGAHVSWRRSRQPASAAAPLRHPHSASPTRPP